MPEEQLPEFATPASGPPIRIGTKGGPYRRRIRLAKVGAGEVWGGLEDDFHHFEVRIQHDGRHVTGVSMEPFRWPWTTCPDAGPTLEPLVGMVLSERCTAVAGAADPRQACTHQFDLAGLCVSHAARGLDGRQYDIELPPIVDRKTTPRLWRDGDLLLEWHLELQEDGYRALVAPEPFTDAPWKGGFMRWADGHLDAEHAEAAVVLRRACDIGMGRGMNLEAIPVAQDLAGLMTGVCYSMQVERMPVAFRAMGTIRDFADNPDDLLRDRPDRSN